MGKKFKGDDCHPIDVEIVDQKCVYSLALKFYDEQLPGGFEKLIETVRAIDKDKYQIIGILHDRDVSIKQIHDAGLEKKHYHLILRHVERRGRTKVKTLLNMLGVVFRPGADNNLWREHGVETVGNFSSFAMYLTHETEKAIQDGKFLYGKDELFSNLEPEEIEQIRDGYCRPSSTRPSPGLMAQLDADAYELGYEMKDFNSWFRSQSYDVRKKTEMRTIKESYSMGLNTRLDELNGSPVIRLCVFIEGEANAGKTFCSRKALAGRKILTVKSGKSGKFDELTPFYDAIILDDTTCSNTLAMTDNYMCRAYRRNSGNPLWTGKYFIVTSNKSFSEWLNDGHIGAANIDAMKSRFYICKLHPGENGVNRLMLMSQSSRGTKAEQEEREAMFREFMERFNKGVAEYAASRLEDGLTGAPDISAYHPDSELGREVTKARNENAVREQLEQAEALEVDGIKVYNAEQLDSIKQDLQEQYDLYDPYTYRLPFLRTSYLPLPKDISNPEPEWLYEVRRMRLAEEGLLSKDDRPDCICPHLKPAKVYIDGKLLFPA